MRIFFIGASSLCADSMEKHVFEVLSSIGHEVRHFNIRNCFQINPKIDRVSNFILRNVYREPERLGERKLLRSMSDYQPDFVLVLLGNMLSPKTVQKIRKIYKGKVVCWCQDQLTTMGRQYLIGCDYDKVFVKDHYLFDMFSKFLDMDVHYLPEACNPVYHKSIQLTDDEAGKYTSDIFTYGNIYYYRQSILEFLKEYDLKVYGSRPDWLVDRLGDKFMGRCVFEEEKCKAVAGARIVLNTLHPGEINSLNARTFEMAGCGGFQLVSYTPAVKEHFVIGEQIEVFRDKAELLEKVNYYLGNQVRAKEIAAAGQSRAYGEHTYEKRLIKLLEISGF